MFNLPAEPARTYIVSAQGHPSGSSATATFDEQVLGPPVVTTQPNSQYYIAGQSLTLTAAASGTPTPAVQWQYSLNGGTSWADLQGATSPTLDVGPLTALENNWELRAEFSNSVGSMSSMPAKMTLVSTQVALPGNAAKVSGQQTLDATAYSGTNKVEYEISGNGLADVVIATASPTYYGWLASWNSTTVANGRYTLQSVAAYPGGVVATSAGITITVNNPAPMSVVLIPTNNGTVAGTSVLLGASATSGVTSLQFVISASGLSQSAIATATLTPYGWLALWDSATVPDGTYTLRSIATYAGGVTGMSGGIVVTVTN
jgi:hypothetical protein